MFNSAPATFGLIAVRVTEPAREREALGALQRARYVDGHDIVSLAGVGEILQSIGLFPQTNTCEHGPGTEQT